MRIFNQDKTIDVPYEKVAIVINNNYVGAEIGNTRYPMATYSTNEMAESAVQKLHSRYEFVSKENYVFCFPAEEEL